jgi:hypothetical protein
MKSWLCPRGTVDFIATGAVHVMKWNFEESDGDVAVAGRCEHARQSVGPTASSDSD